MCFQATNYTNRHEFTLKIIRVDSCDSWQIITYSYKRKIRNLWLRLRTAEMLSNVKTVAGI